MAGDKAEHVVVGDVVCIRDADEHIDEVSCLVWFNGEDDDVTTVKITTPAGMFQLRDQIEVIFRKSDREQRRLIEWIERKGGVVTAREVQQGHRQYRTAQDAEAALEELTKAGCGDWEPTPPGPKGGRPSRLFRLKLRF